MLLDASSYVLPRFIFQRLLGFVYLIAFAIVVNQFRGLCGQHGLQPVSLFVKRIEFWDSPSLFWFFSSDDFIMTIAWLGLLLSVVATLGLSDIFANWISIVTWLLLWMIYLSFVNVGQTFYGFGWEILLLETGFLAIFLGSIHTSPSTIMIWLMRWLLFRVMFGAGMIKLRGDSCWRDLTCLKYYYETQPMPNPLSWYFHYQPMWMLRAGVLVNHFVELIVPFGFFGPRPVRLVAGVITILFQLTLIASGNLSWLNIITIVLCFACFDDAFLNLFASIIPKSVATSASGVQAFVIYGLAILVLTLSIRPAWNLFSRTQIMNTSFDPLHLVNTYGAFGSVTRKRYEIVIEGTEDAEISSETKWLEYEFNGKPGATDRRPPQVTPYHYKLDWQMWFAAMDRYWNHPWIINLMAKLLHGQQEVVGLLRHNPFSNRPPQFVRALLYRYQFSKPGEDGWWKREYVGEYLPPLSLDDPSFSAILREQGWE